MATAAPGAKPTPGKSKPSPSKTPKPTKAPVPPCAKPESFPASKETVVPWAQTRLDFTRAWQFSKGKGVTVAVVDSGINANHPQLRGRVRRQEDLTHTHPTDCYGHGTLVAGIIAGQDMRNAKTPVAFLGVAPDVHLYSVKVQTSEESTDNGQLLAAGIRRAAEMNPDIINVSIQNTSYSALYSAVQYALRKKILIVAAAGNTDQKKKASEQPAYPASYSGCCPWEPSVVTGRSQASPTRHRGSTSPRQETTSSAPAETGTSEDRTSTARATPLPTSPVSPR